jgi:perosamine synthetase
VKNNLPNIPVFRPGFDDDVLEALRKVFKSGWLGSGPRSIEFEKAFAAYTGSEYAVALTSGTAALHLSCLALGLGPGDEVLAPAFTFASTAHAPTYCGAEVVFVDIEPETYTMDPADLETKITPRSRAVIPVHYGGQPCRMNEIWSIAEAHNLDVIEDAAHGCGGSYHGVRIGGLEKSKLTCFSFNALKNLSTGDGGMVTTNCPEIAAAIKKLRWMGIDKDTFERRSKAAENGESSDDVGKYQWFYEIHDLGFKYLMNDISATIGLTQLGKLASSISRRREMAALYQQKMEGLAWLKTPKERAGTKSAWHLFPIRTRYRDELRKHLQNLGIASSVHYYPLHMQPFYRKTVGEISLKVTEKAAQEILTIPFHPNLVDSEVERVISAVLEFEPKKKDY